MLAGERVQINTGIFSNDMTNFQGMQQNESNADGSEDVIGGTEDAQ